MNSKAEGRVLKVLNRNSNLIVGTFTENKNFGFVVPDDINVIMIFLLKKVIKIVQKLMTRLCVN